MHNLEIKINKLKDELYEINYGVSEDSDLIKLVKMKEVEDELHEILVLIHSNNRNEFNALKGNNFNLMLKIIDIQTEFIAKSNLRFQILENNKQKSEELFNIKNLLLLLASATGIFILFLLSYIIAPESTQSVFNSVTSTITAIKGK